MKTRNDLTDLAHRLVLHAARKAPAALADRLAEEWLADLQSRSGALSRLRLALGCCWATTIISRDFRVPQLATSGAVNAHRPVLADLQQGLPLLSRRTIAFILIAGFHVLLIYCFATGLAQQVVASIPTVIHASFPVEIRPQHLPPPPLATNLRFRKIQTLELPPVETQNIDYPADDPPPPLTREPGPSPNGREGLRAAVRVVGGPGTGFPTTDDYYPAASRRIAETGAATVQVCVDRQGRLTAEPTLTRSSGSRRIDDGALNLAKAGSGHYRPTTEDGQPVNACYPYRIRFQLN